MFKTKQFRVAAEELVEVLGLTQKTKSGKTIPVVIEDDLSIEELVTTIKEAIAEIQKGDEFTDETQAIIDELSTAPVDEDLDDDAPTPVKKKAAPVDDDDEQEVAEKIHKKNVASKPINAGKKPVVEDEEEEEVPVPKKKAKVVVEDVDEDEDDVKPAKKEKTPKEKKEHAPSPYGSAVNIMTTNPDMKIEELNKKLTKLGIDVIASKSAVQTGFGVVRKIVSLLRENSLMS